MKHSTVKRLKSSSSVTPAHVAWREAKHRVSEKQEQAAIVDLLKLIGAQVYVIGTKRRKGDYPGTMQTPGIPDLYCFFNEQPLWIEVKARDGRASEAQQEFADYCELSRHAYFRGTADGFTAYLRELGFRIQ